jgi:hypothetical protein
MNYVAGRLNALAGSSPADRAIDDSRLAARAPAVALWRWFQQGWHGADENEFAQVQSEVAPTVVEGPAGMTLAEITVRGILQSRSSLVAMIQGSGYGTYIVHQGDKFLDGTIKTITPTGLVVVQEVNDPSSLVKFREVRKLVQSADSRP